MKSGVSPQKLRKYRWQTPIWASICTPVALSLLISLGNSPRLGGTIFVWEAQALIWGSTAPECPPPPRGAGPAQHVTIIIESNLIRALHKSVEI